MEEIERDKNERTIEDRKSDTGEQGKRKKNKNKRETERERDTQTQTQTDRLWERKRKISKKERSTYIMTFKRIDDLREIEKQKKMIVDQ